MSIASQPLSRLQWVETGTLKANAWNPNKVFKPELELLKLSLLENGWTQPIVVGDDNEIVDGFHRWTLARTDAEVNAMTDGLVPVVPLRDTSDQTTRMLATVRHNRARGTHNVVKMADIVDQLHEHGMSDEQIGSELGMDEEEVARLLARGNMLERGDSKGQFNAGWEPSAQLSAERRAIAQADLDRRARKSK